MPDRARPYRPGLLQALVGGRQHDGRADQHRARDALETVRGRSTAPGGRCSSSASLPALLCSSIIRRRLKEPERWQPPRPPIGDGSSKLGSIAELFGDPRWRRNAIVGMLLAFAGVVGLWGIGFFSFDLIRSVLRPASSRREGLAEPRTSTAG